MCYNEKFVKDAEQAGLILKGLGRDGNYRLYQFEECGHEQEIQIVHVRNHNFVCNICETTSRDLPSYVYILKISYESKTWLKLGYAKFINARVKGYGLPTSATVDLICSSEFKTGRLAHEHESAIHSKYIEKKNDPSVMKEYHAWSGHNECYPMSMLKTLQSEIFKDKV